MDENESLFWADQTARQIIERVEKEPQLRKIVKEKGYIIYDEKTPSGKIHIGSGRGWVIHDTIARALCDLGKKARFILSSDDMDPFDAMPSYIDALEYKKYMGVPFRNVPSPETGYKSYADFYFSECIEKFPDFGINAELESTGQRYINGDFNKCIKLALDNAQKIQQIYSQLYGKTSASEKLPFNPICEKCGKIGTTLAYEWDSEKEVVKYKCKPDLVEWAQGCGHESEISPYNGNGKLPWKVEWAAKWPTIGVVYETAGKDHFTEGGSRSIAVAISNEIFDFPPPLPSTRTKIGKGYEFFTIGGKKMSTSKGLGSGFAELAEHIPGKILRYLLVKTRPRAVIDFEPYETNKLILLYDNYDKTERIYFGKEEIENKRDKEHEKRIYELSAVGKITEKMPPQISVSYASIVVQSVNFDIEKAVLNLRKTGHLPEKLSKDEMLYVKERLVSAEKWIKEFAPEEFKFIVAENIPEKAKNLTEKQKDTLKKLSKELSEKKFKNEAELEKFIYDFAKKELSPKELFEVAYIALLGKPKGPRLAPFLLCIGLDFAVKRFGEL